MFIQLGIELFNFVIYFFLPFNIVKTRNGERLVCWLSVFNGGNSVIFEHGIAGARGVAVKVAMLLNLMAFNCLDSLNSLLQFPNQVILLLLLVIVSDVLIIFHKLAPLLNNRLTRCIILECLGHVLLCCWLVLRARKTPIEGIPFAQKGI